LVTKDLVLVPKTQLIFTKNALIVKIMYKRYLLSRLEFLAKRPVIVLTGARRVGKTTLLREWVKERKEKVYWLNGDSPAEAVRWQRLLAGQPPEDTELLRLSL
jgi:predicted AAA+ superfamily ATPase